MFWYRVPRKLERRLYSRFSNVAMSVKVPPASTGASLSQMKSRELIRRAKSGDGDAMERLFGRYLPQLQRWARRRVPTWARNAVDTGDLVQETVLHTIKNLDAFEPQRDGALLGYLRRGLLNRVRDQFRNAARRPAPTELRDNHVDTADSPLERVIADQDRERYAAALGRLRPRDRDAIVGRIEVGYTYEQLALMLGKPSPEAARLAVRRALLRLAKEMTLAG